MPPTLAAGAQQFFAQVAANANGVRALAGQPDLVIADASGQSALRTGQLQKFPLTGGNYTCGYGLCVLSEGSGSAPVFRAGIITWTSPAGGTVTIMGLVALDSDGLVRAVWDAAGLRTYDTSGNVTATVFGY